MQAHKKNWTWIWPCLWVVASSIVLGLVARRGPLAMDTWFYETVFPHLPKNGHLELAKFLSFIGSAKLITPAMVIALLYAVRKKNWGTWLFLLLGSLGSSLENSGLKLLFERERPWAYMLIEKVGPSYPSGHAMVNFSLGLTIATLLSLKFSCQRKLIWTIVLVLVMAIGLSRLVLGVHWPTDIMGGWLMGSGVYLLHRHFWQSQFVKWNRGGQGGNGQEGEKI